LIQPSTAEEVRYTNMLGANLVRAHTQVAGGDKPGSKAFTAAYRALLVFGEGKFGQRAEGLREWADMVAREVTNGEEGAAPERLRRFIDQQDLRLADLATPTPEPATEQVAESGGKLAEPEPEPVKPARKHRLKKETV
jgi:hypothetical protein